MSEGTKIEWATHTFNPWIGCTKVSPGCANCYAENSTPARVLRKRERETWGKGANRQRTSEGYWKGPLLWNRFAWECPHCHTRIAEPEELGRPGVCPNCDGAQGSQILQQVRARVFPSLCDWLDDEVPIEWLADFLKVIHDTPNLDWLLLTKRPENFTRRIGSLLSTMFMRDDWRLLWIEGKAAPHNVWIGASAEDQPRLDQRVPQLLKIPASVRFLSLEPLLGGLSITKIGHDYEHTDCLRGIHRQFNSDGQCRESSVPKIDWVIVGGESGPKARPCNVEWIRDIVRQCQTAGVPCFVKQLGSNATVRVLDAGGLALNPRLQAAEIQLLKEMRHPKGGDMNEWAHDLRVREFPNNKSDAVERVPTR